MNDLIGNAVACSLLPFVALGCQKTAPPAEPGYAGGSMASYSWSPTDADTDPLPGVDQAHLWCWWTGDKPALLIWTDVEDADGRSVATPEGGFEGQLNQIPIEFQDRTITSGDGTVTIAGTDYDMANGSMFLVSTQTERPVVKQLNRNAAELDILKADGTGADNEKLKSLARTEADILAFFETSANKSHTP